MTTFAFERATASLLRRTSGRIEARAQRRAQRATAVKTARTVGVALRRIILQGAGLAALVLAAGTVSSGLELLTAAASLFVFAWLLDG